VWPVARLVKPAFTTASRTRHSVRRSTRPYISESLPPDGDASDRSRSDPYSIPVSGVRKEKVESESPGTVRPKKPCSYRGAWTLGSKPRVPKPLTRSSNRGQPVRPVPSLCQRRGSSTPWSLCRMARTAQPLTGRSAVNERIRERGGEQDAQDGEPTPERPGKPLSDHPSPPIGSRKPLRILTLKRAPLGALCPGFLVNRSVAGFATDR
jgi:hypothetical protein